MRPHPERIGCCDKDKSAKKLTHGTVVSWISFLYTHEKSYAVEQGWFDMDSAAKIGEDIYE